jgi:steroid 5-alpha reductase family enzyme
VAEIPRPVKSDLDRDNLRHVAGLSALAVTAVQTVTATLAVKANRRDYADVVWGPGLAAVAVVGALAGRGEPRRRWALAAVSTGWAARLERQMFTRVVGIAQLLVSAPLQFAAASRVPRGPRRWLAPAGLAMMVGGAVTEALADRQKDVYSALGKDEKPEILDTGLWGWSRHPNYFGDSLVWDGAWLAAAASAPAALTLPAPMAMSYLLMFATGAKRTERRMEDRPGYRDYQQRVSFFFPRPQRRS